MKKIISSAIISVVFIASTAFAQMSGKGMMEGGDHGKMMGTEKSNAMMSGQTMNHNMMQNMSQMMGQMDEMMKNMSEKMKDHAGMDKTKMHQMSNVMKDMSSQMNDMSNQMEKGDMSDDTNKKMKMKMDSMNKDMEKIK